MNEFLESPERAEQRIQGLRKAQSEKLAELCLLGSLFYTKPACYVQTPSSFWAIKQEEPFVGQRMRDAILSTYAEREDPKNQATFDSGFIMSYARRHSMGSVWVGNTLQHLSEISATLGIEVTEEALQKLVQSGEPVYFFLPDCVEQRPVYVLDQRQAAVARTAGYLTQVQGSAAKNTQWREVQTGDQLIRLSRQGNWPKPIDIYAPDWLPADQYRRV